MSTTTTTMPPEQRVSKVFELLENSGKKEHISGKMTQLDHALHVANLAMREGADEETILAGLLIDISQHDKKQAVQLPTNQAPDFMAVDRYEADDFSPSNYGFSYKTCELATSISLANSYYSTKKFESGDYTGTATMIFDAVPRTLPLPAEILNFEKDPLFKQKVQLAKWDNAATNITGVKPPALGKYRDMAFRNLYMSEQTLY
ncbi:hypothetical protein GGI13_003436 [Coemansia sp. RSA 455]|nr:hypothetical protein GGI13_003436 [Coemansia sp. RSA 455]